MGFQIEIAERVSGRRRRGSSPWIAIVIIGLVMLTVGMLYWTLAGDSRRDDTPGGAPPQRQGPLATFDLVDHTGKNVTADDFRGRYMLVYLGFTSCPDTCPAALTAISEVLDRLGNHGELIEALFITIDPERDTPTVMAEYLKPFQPRIRGLTGSAEQVRHVREAFHVQSARVPGGIGLPLRFDRFPPVYFVGPDGEYLTHFSHRLPPVKIIERILPFM